MTNDSNIAGFLASAIGEILHIVSQIFSVIIGFLSHGLEYIGIIFSLFIFLIPLIFSIFIFFITHVYLLLVIAECIILVKTMTTSGFMRKLNTFFGLHVSLFMVILHMPRYLTELMNMIINIFQTIYKALEMLWMIISNIIGFIVTSASASITGTIIISALVILIIGIFSIIHI